MGNPTKRGESSGQVSTWANPNDSFTPLSQTSFLNPYGLTLRQTITSSGSVTIPAGITWVYVVMTSGGGGSFFGYAGNGGEVTWGWTIPQTSCVIGAGGLDGQNGGFTRYGHLIATGVGTRGASNRPANYYGQPPGTSFGDSSAVINGTVGANAGGGSSGNTGFQGGNGGDGISGGNGGSGSQTTATATGGNGGSGLTGGGGGAGLNTSGTRIGGNGGNGLGIDGTVYTGGTGTTTTASNNGGGGGAGIAGNGGNASGATGGTGGVGGGGAGKTGTGGAGILYIFY